MPNCCQLYCMYVRAFDRRSTAREGIKKYVRRKHAAIERSTKSLIHSVIAKVSIKYIRIAIIEVSI